MRAPRWQTQPLEAPSGHPEGPRLRASFLLQVAHPTPTVPALLQPDMVNMATLSTLHTAVGKLRPGGQVRETGQKPNKAPSILHHPSHSPGDGCDPLGMPPGLRGRQGGKQAGMGDSRNKPVPPGLCEQRKPLPSEPSPK